MARDLSQRPSQLIGLTKPRDRWLAYQFDAAIALWGRWVDNKLEATDSKGKPKHTLDALLADADPGQRAAKQYQNPLKVLGGL